uniref:Sulfate_transp domain-containing protein n=1 Tax=Caenorhabditis japonica TaxID=281687 RepID=A0A8R1HK12_CAEJA
MKTKSNSSETWKKFIPITKWLPSYSVKENLINDIIGGITVGILHVPQGMAYASLVGLKPVYGLYTSLFPSLIYMLFGTSRHVSLGVFAVVSLMSGSCNLRVTQEIVSSYGSNLTKTEIEEISVNVVKSLGLAIGLIQILLFLLKANYLISYLSDQIILGFTTGAAVHVFTAQLNKIIGVALPRHTGIGKLFYIYQDLINSILDDKVNKTTLAMSLVAIAVLYIAKYHLTPALCAKTRIPIPFPSPALPDVTLIQKIFNDAIAIAVVSVVVTVSMGKVMAKKNGYTIDVRQEFLALGMVTSACSMFPCWPASTALARTIINENAGTKTQLSAIFSASVLTLVLFFIGPLLEHLPTVCTIILSTERCKPAPCFALISLNLTPNAYKILC